MSTTKTEPETRQDRPATLDPRTVRLYEIAEEMETIFAEIEAADGEITDEISTRLDARSKDFETKVESCVFMLLNYNETADAAKRQKDRLAAIEKANRRRSDWLRGYVLAQMQRTNTGVVDLRDGTAVRIMKSPKPTIAWLGKPEEIPMELQRVRLPELDKVAALEAFKAGVITDAQVKVEYSDYIKLGARKVSEK